MDHKMRRIKQELSLDETKAILFNGQECIIAVCDEDKVAIIEISILKMTGKEAIELTRQRSQPGIL